MSGIKLTDLVKTISGIDAIRENVGNYVPDKEDPLELNLSSNPAKGQRKVVSTWTLKVVFDVENDNVSNVAVLGRMNYRRDKIAASVAKEQGVRYSNPRFYNGWTNSLKQVKLNARRVMDAEADYKSRDEMLFEQSIANGRGGNY